MRLYRASTLRHTAALFCSAFFVLGASGSIAQTGAPQDFSLQDFAGRAFQEAPATLYTAREFITMDPNRPRAEAVAVKDGKFVAVGTRAEVGAAVGRNARLDKTFNDKVVIAGFVEQHVHPVLAALTMNTKVISIEDWDAIDGFSPAVRDEKAYQERLKGRSRNTRTRAGPSSPGATTTTSTAKCRARC
ncbi:MAG: hypothetical protein MUE48_01550 [Desulfobacterales bacterium]|jgi:hypothetical protein|nr:hypothetical protein [Desulfobacterales bacterium]